MRCFADTTGIKRLINAAQDRMAAHVESDDDSSVISESDDDASSSKSEVGENEPLKEAVTGTSATERSYKGTKKVSGAIASEAVDMHKRDKHSVSPCVVWLVNRTKSLTRHRDCR